MVPQDGKDEVYDKIMTEIGELEETLEDELKTFEKKLGYIYSALRLWILRLITRYTGVRLAIGTVLKVTRYAV